MSRRNKGDVARPDPKVWTVEVWKARKALNHASQQLEMVETPQRHNRSHLPTRNAAPG